MGALRPRSLPFMGCSFVLPNYYHLLLPFCIVPPHPLRVLRAWLGARILFLRHPPRHPLPQPRLPQGDGAPPILARLWSTSSRASASPSFAVFPPFPSRPDDFPIPGASPSGSIAPLAIHALVPCPRGIPCDVSSPHPPSPHSRPAQVRASNILSFETRPFDAAAHVLEDEKYTDPETGHVRFSFVFFFVSFFFFRLPLGGGLLGRCAREGESAGGMTSREDLLFLPPRPFLPRSCGARLAAPGFTRRPSLLSYLALSLFLAHR